MRALSDVRAGAGGGLATARAKASGFIAQVRADAIAGAASRRKRTQELFEETDRLARSTLQRGAAAAEATFREVVAQGPEKTLGRGFAVVHGPAGDIVTSAAAAGAAGSVRVQFQDGSIDASVRRGEENT